MNVQKTIDNHYMRILRKNEGSATVEDCENHDRAILKFEEMLINEGSDMALNYVTAPINERYELTSMYDGEDY